MQRHPRGCAAPRILVSAVGMKGITTSGAMEIRATDVRAQKIGGRPVWQSVARTDSARSVSEQTGCDMLRGPDVPQSWGTSCTSEQGADAPPSSETDRVSAPRGGEAADKVSD